MIKNKLLMVGTGILFSLAAMGQDKVAEKKASFEKEACTDACKETAALSCKLTSKEFQVRKETVLRSLGKQVVEKKDLSNGFSYKFANSDKMLDELIEFIKTERQCCDFFDFVLTVSAGENAIWLNLTGPKNAKEFIQAELNL